MRPNPHRSRAAFTLVEMLVVITIIGILIALLVPTISGVMARTRNAVIATEVQELSRAVEAYKAKVGDYPPDFTNYLALTNHISKAYTRNTRVISTWLATVPPSNQNAPGNLDPAEALVFWLSMTKRNVRDPLAGTGEAEVYFKFDETRLKDFDGDGWKEYYPQHGPDAPYVYFDGRQLSALDAAGTSTLPTYSYAWAIYPSPYTTTGGSPNPAPNVPQRDTSKIPTLTTTPSIGVVRPYRSNLAVPTTEIPTWQDTTTRTQWMEPAKFQIISAGMDNHFGEPEPTTWFKSFPTMNYYSNGADRTNDESNIANFSAMKTLGDSVP
jgi:prepilin-type N-terminal cleavage/methylation domain-containing protein